ncbi:hypothetical protein QKD28_gp4 [Wenling hoplichthys paramyxovirus]|uniref:Uncharacterized protein n=1 Tax=Wenling hoplichthys paramyxovirus TaxID=2116453 RepID=A0A2P1GN27_9MONO|nr:hypothetical protein QKD28_gp4 [Wenling hoplichthys paramyxovirus]AVM87395.1 hypothetical protein [Wenling hoplichthys paramyxovirus]
MSIIYHIHKPGGGYFISEPSKITSLFDLENTENLLTSDSVYMSPQPSKICIKEFRCTPRLTDILAPIEIQDTGEVEIITYKQDCAESTHKVCAAHLAAFCTGSVSICAGNLVEPISDIQGGFLVSTRKERSIIWGPGGEIGHVPRAPWRVRPVLFRLGIKIGVDLSDEQSFLGSYEGLLSVKKEGQSQRISENSYHRGHRRAVG